MVSQTPQSVRELMPLSFIEQSEVDVNTCYSKALFTLWILVLQLYTTTSTDPPPSDGNAILLWKIYILEPYSCIILFTFYSFIAHLPSLRNSMLVQG